MNDIKKGQCAGCDKIRKVYPTECDLCRRGTVYLCQACLDTADLAVDLVCGENCPGIGGIYDGHPF